MDQRKKLAMLKNELIARKGRVYARNPQMTQWREQPSINTASTVKGIQNMPDNQNAKVALFKQVQQLENRCQNANQQYKRLESLVKQAEMDLRSDHIYNDSARAMQYNLSLSSRSVMMPGNVGDINQVIWPFWFTARDAVGAAPVLVPGASSLSSFTVTQEAAFVIMEITAQVFIEDDQNAGQFEYADPAQPDGSGKVNNLSYILKDSSSSRVFNEQATDINTMGYWEWPTKMKPPMLLLPNSNFEVVLSNEDADNTYAVLMTFFGYRIRIDKAQELLSTVVG